MRDESWPQGRTPPKRQRYFDAPVTRTVRGIATEVPLGPAEGLPAECAATIDNTLAFPKTMLVRRIGALGPPRLTQLCGAWRAAVDC